MINRIKNKILKTADITTKKIILKHPKGARLANQLWNFVSVYAYCLKMNYECKNYSFFEDKKQVGRKNSIDSYYNYFDFPKYKYIKFLFKINFILNKLSNKFRLYYRYVEFIEKYRSDKILSDNESVFYLSADKKIDKIYLDGWLFRNPEGLEKYRKEIVEYFKPKKNILKYIDGLISPIKKEYTNIVGVHIRQSDYKEAFEQGKYYFNEKEVRKILDDYLQFSGKSKNDIMFLICSDEKINKMYFEGLNYTICNGNVVEDLFTLASCDTIIGSNSTFGAWASYYGNIPLIVFERDQIDWNYYKNKDLSKYFENKKCTLNYY